jgi:serine/threonine-protein kinase
MADEKWQKVREVFDSALRLKPDERQRFIREVCGEDKTLFAEVESLFLSLDSAESFMETPAVAKVAAVIEAESKKLEAGKSFGHYEIVRKIGEGGMGEVYLAIDNSLERNTAIKILPGNVAQDEERMQRFVREAKSASALNHPNIITIYEIGETDNTHFIATEYIEGETIRERLKGTTINFKSGLEIAIQVASALDAAHRAGIVHRDIKPENVMIRPDGFVKILDFGIAKLSEAPAVAGGSNVNDSESKTAINAHTSPGMIIGTAAYMSPEQAQGKAVDARSDIFSFGVMLYEMLAGKPPFGGENAMDVIGSILNKEPVPLSRQTPEVPHEIERIINKALRRDREERYQTAKDLLVDLKDVKQDLEFQNKLEGTSAPGALETKTPGSNATPSPIDQHTTSSAEYIVSEIKQHKRGFAIGLAILLLAAVGAGVRFLSNRPANLTNIESIAVMPFVNESGNADSEYLSDGMTETLISSLSQLPRLSVKARSSVFRYKGKDINPQTVGNELSVQAVLLGRVIQRGDQLTLRLELVDARNENLIWSEQYTRKQADLVSLQTEIARDVSNKLKTKLSGADEQKLAKKFTENTEAYQLYLKGRYHWNKRTPTDIRKSIEYFRQAIDQDPTYALAYAALAEAYVLIPSYIRDSPKESYERARTAAIKALEMDETLADAHTALAIVKNEYDWNFAEAERDFKRAIELNPNDATTHQFFSEYLIMVGRYEEAIAEIKRAQELDPLSLIINAMAGPVYAESGRYDQAIEQLRKTIEMDQNFPRAHMYLAVTYERSGMFGEAISEFEKHSILRGISPEKAAKEAAVLREAYKKSGANGYWRKKIEIGEKERALHLGTSPTLSAIAVYYAQIGETDKAVALLEKAYEQRESNVRRLKSPLYGPIRSDPRFQDLIRRVGLPQ